MDSLLANYASSDDELENPNQSSLLSSKPISSSFLSSIPQPKSKQQFSTSNIHHSNEDYNAPTSSSKLSSSLPLSSLPQPKTQKSVSKTGLNLAPSKKVVQFKPPINPSYAKSADFDDDDDEDEDEDEGERKRKQRKESESLPITSSVKSLFSTMPAPRNSATLGALPSGAGSGRRAIVDTEAPSLSVGSFGSDKGKIGIDGSASASYEQVSNQNGENYVDYGGYSSYESGNTQDPSLNVATGDYGSTYENYSGSENYGDHGQYGSSWSNNGLSADVPESTGVLEIPFRRSGKRGRNDVPIEIIEVKQDELTKDRPRVDKSKLTGIAFGPAYQAAPSSKGKPSKLHKRKHQIGTLFHDMKQKEMELAERRAKGFLTKAETHAKYGW